MAKKKGLDWPSSLDPTRLVTKDGLIMKMKKQKAMAEATGGYVSEKREPVKPDFYVKDKKTGRKIPGKRR